MGTSNGGIPPNGGGGRNNVYKPTSGKRASWIRRVLHKIGFVRNIDEFLQPRRQSLWIFIKTAMSIILPCLGIAFLFYYTLDNPDTSRFSGDKNANDDNGDKASISWWILFLGVRQVVTFSAAHFLGLILVDFICLEHRWSLVCFGPTLTLLSKLTVGIRGCKWR